MLRIRGRNIFSRVFPGLAATFVLGFAAAFAAVDGGAPGDAGSALDLATPEAVVDVGSSLATHSVRDPKDPESAWFTLAVQNRTTAPVVRVLAAADQPGASLAFAPTRMRPTIAEAAVSNSGVVIERAPGFGLNAFRVVMPPTQAATLALRIEGVKGLPSLLAWSEPALIAHNRQIAILSGVVSGLLAAALAFAAGAAALSGRLYARWASLFLAALLVAELTSIGVFDNSILIRLGGPYGLFALALSIALLRVSMRRRRVASDRPDAPLRLRIAFVVAVSRHRSRQFFSTSLITLARMAYSRHANDHSLSAARHVLRTHCLRHERKRWRYGECERALLERARHGEGSVGEWPGVGKRMRGLPRRISNASRSLRSDQLTAASLFCRLVSLSRSRRLD